MKLQFNHVTIMIVSDYNVYIGSETGFLKGVNTHKEKTENVAGEKVVCHDNEINAICWNNSSQEQIIIGRRGHMIDVYDIKDSCIVDSHNIVDVKGPFKGISKVQEKLVTCTEAGDLIISDFDNESQEKFNVGENVCKMRLNRNCDNKVATGGKENLLKVWDLNDPSKPVFKAKNVSNDWLDLRVPIWVTDIQFIGGEKIVTSTGTHKIRLYDPKTNTRKPVIEVDYDEYPFTALCIPSDENYAIIGNTKGNMALLDFRKKAMAHCYKGFAGSIRDIEYHSEESLIASCGLDRFLRIHDYNSRNLVNKIYLKSRLNCLLLRDNFGKKSEEPSSEIEKANLKRTNENEILDHEDDALWSSLKPVQKNKKQKINSKPEIVRKKSNVKR